MLVPRPAVVLRTEDLPGAAHAVDLVGIPWMERHGHHRALGLDAVVEARPGLAEASAAVERSVLAARGRAEACVEDAGIVRRNEEVAAIRERREAADVHGLPVGPALRAPEEAHADGEEHGARPRGAHAECVTIQCAFVVCCAVDSALDLRSLRSPSRIGSSIL